MFKPGDLVRVTSHYMPAQAVQKLVPVGTVGVLVGYTGHTSPQCSVRWFAYGEGYETGMYMTELEKVDVQEG